MKVRFLIDENLTPRLKAAIRRHNAEIDVLRVGDEGTPPLQTLDPDILRYLETTQRLLITDNRSSIPGHITDHAAADGTQGNPSATTSASLSTRLRTGSGEYPKFIRVPTRTKSDS